jgi:outer membrane protein assembly factor BamA
MSLGRPRTPWTHPLIAAALTAACASTPTPRAGVQRLTAVGFEGNQRLGDKTLLTGLGLHRVLQRKGGVDPYLVQVDADRIRGEYLRKGYLDVDVRSRVERKGDAETVVYTIEEGVRAVTRTVITGLPADVQVAKIREQLPLKDGAPFVYEQFDLARPKLLVAVQDAGYAHAKLDALVIADRARHTATIELSYTPGPKCTFGPVEVVGVTGELADAVRNRVTFKPGQVYSAQAIIDTQRNLYGFGRFSTVRVQPDTASNKEVVGVQVAVSQGARHEVTLGGGFGMEPTLYEVRGRAGYTIEGWPFPLDIVTIDTRPGYAQIHKQGTSSSYEPRIRASVKLTRQDLFWTYTKGEIEGGYNYLTTEPYTSFGPFGRLGFETRLGTYRVLARAGWDIQSVGFRNIDPLVMPIAADLGIDHNERIAAFRQALVVDLRDHPIEPKLGAYGEINTGEATRFAGSAYEYFQLVGDLRGYVPLPLGTVLAGRARYGALYGNRVPPTERFFAGGSNSQRGFSERQLSPHVPMMPASASEKIIPYGGAGLIETGLEARVPITTIRQMPLGIAAFLDGGDVTNTVSELDTTNLHWAAGLGLRLQTVVGPARFDVAYRLNRTSLSDPEPGQHWAYHLTIGEAF